MEDSPRLGDKERGPANLHPTSHNRARAAGVAALVCATAAFFQLYLGLQAGGVPPEFVLFGALAIIFGALWASTRNR